MNTKKKKKILNYLTLQADNTQEQGRKHHQKELSKRLNEEAKERLLSQKGGVAKEKYVFSNSI